MAKLPAPMSDDKTPERADDGPGNFVADIVREDLAAGRVAPEQPLE